MTELAKLYDIFIQHPVICNDTRRITKGCIYWALKGERFDGNTFVRQALEQGAAYAVTDDPALAADSRCLLVENTLETLQALARHHRRALGLKVVAIVGSNGKTTTKELMYRVLNEKLHAFATPGNYNNHIGLPLSILQLTKAHQVAILELGANHPGENALLCDIAEPDMGLITNIGKDHLEGFGGLDGVEKASLELFDFLAKNNGTAFVNMDDERIRRNTGNLKTLTYGWTEPGDISGDIVSKFPFISVKITDHVSNIAYEVDSHLFGSVNLYNILAAAAAGSYFEVDPWQIKNAVESYIPANNRSQVVHKDTNTFILDAYNANPSSMIPAIKDFASYPAEHKILILGDMFELGEDSHAEHQQVLDLIEYAQFEQVAAAGHAFYAFKGLYEAAFFEDTAGLKKWFQEQHFIDSVFYLKGSRGMALEKILEDNNQQ